MILVVDEGFLATRKGRLIDQNFKENSPISSSVLKERFKLVLMKILNMILVVIFGQAVFLGSEKLGPIFLYQSKIVRIFGSVQY